MVGDGGERGAVSVLIAGAQISWGTTTWGIRWGWKGVAKRQLDELKTAGVYTYIHVYVKEGARDVGADYFRTRFDIRTNMSSWRNSPFLLRLFHGADGSTSVMS